MGGTTPSSPPSSPTTRKHCVVGPCPCSPEESRETCAIHHPERIIERVRVLIGGHFDEMYRRVKSGPMAPMDLVILLSTTHEDIVRGITRIV